MTGRYRKFIPNQFGKDEDGNETPTANISAKINKPHINHTAAELECYAAKRSVEKFKPRSLPFTIFTDHSSELFHKKIYQEGKINGVSKYKLLFFILSTVVTLKMSYSFSYRYR